MTELTLRYIEDFLPYLKPDRRDAFRNRAFKAVEERGEIVDIKDTRSPDGKRVVQRRYYHENGRFGTLDAARVGVDCLEKAQEKVLA